jgi:hypothetical protein
MSGDSMVELFGGERIALGYIVMEYEEKLPVCGNITQY